MTEIEGPVEGHENFSIRPCFTVNNVEKDSSRRYTLYVPINRGLSYVALL